jgi:protocatechuate 3,4-dioxygenase beta subunit
MDFLPRLPAILVLASAFSIVACHTPVAGVNPCVPTPTGQPSLLVRNEPAAAGLLDIRVLDGRSSAPMGSAIVDLTSQALRGSTDSHGLVQFASLSPGRYIVRVRSIGYFPVLDSLALTEHAGRRLLYHMFVRPSACEELVP